MSWDILIQDLPNVALIEDIPSDFQPKPLGKRDEVVGRIASVFPDADFSSPAWGVLDRKDWSIEFNVGESALCDGLMLHVRGTGPDVTDAVLQVIKALGARGLDMQTGKFFRVEDSQASFREWQSYRDKVIEQSQRKHEGRKPTGLFGRIFGSD